MDTIRRLEWKSVFDTVHGYLFRYHKAGDDRVRPSDGIDNADIHSENSRAVVSTVYGNTVKWNQLFSPGNPYPSSMSGIRFTLNTNKTYSVVGTASARAAVVIKTNIPIHSNKIYIRYSKDSINLRIEDLYSGTFTINRSSILNAPLGRWDLGFSVASGAIVNYTVFVEIFDLTAMGIDNLTTPEEVESWLALNVGTQDYYPYDEGSLISFGGTAVKSVGFNQWTGATAKVLSGQEYYIGGTYTSLSYSDGTSIVPTNRLFTANKTDNVTITGGSTDTVLNLSCDKNGTYAPYWENSCDLSFAQNIPDPSNPSQPLFPNGLCSAGSVHDEVSATIAIKRIIGIDLGTINWLKTDNSTFYRNLPYGKYTGGNNGISNAIMSANYQLTTGSWERFNDKQYSVGSNVMSATTCGIAIRDTSYTDANIFKTAMSGVILYYELATPIELSLNHPMTYKVDKYSTEELVAPTSQTGAPTSSALNADIDYQYRS